MRNFAIAQDGVLAAGDDDESDTKYQVCQSFEDWQTLHRTAGFG